MSCLGSQRSNNRPHGRGRRGLTLVEVLAATLLAAMLMAALLGVLRGLKASEQALDVRASDPPWQHAMGHALDRDLQNARTYRATATEFLISGPVGTAADGTPTWSQGEIGYIVGRSRDGTWLVRITPATAEGSPAERNLVLAGVTEIRVGMTPAGLEDFSSGPASPATLAIGTGREEPLVAGLTLEFWGDNREQPLYRHRYRTP